MLQPFARGLAVKVAVSGKPHLALPARASMARMTRRAVATRSYKISDSEIDSSLSSAVSDYEPPASPDRVGEPAKLKAAMEMLDPEVDSDIPAGEEEVKEAVSRLPPVNSGYIPLPWKGRLGYVSIIFHFPGEV